MILATLDTGEADLSKYPSRDAGSIGGLHVIGVTGAEGGGCLAFGVGDTTNFLQPTAITFDHGEFTFLSGKGHTNARSGVKTHGIRFETGANPVGTEEGGETVATCEFVAEFAKRCSTTCKNRCEKS